MLSGVPSSSTSTSISSFPNFTSLNITANASTNSSSSNVLQPTTMTTNGHNTLYPALYLYPLNDTWAPKHIALSSVHTKIGRQTSSKTAPGEKNGFFDSKVLSRQHAEVWEEGGKIYIKDVKSSNGTFINGERLSSEGHESDPFELKSDDIVEFGIDIVGEDNKTIIHHKVAARVVCVFSEQDAQVAARAEQHQQQQQLHQQQFLQQQQQQQQQSGSHGVSGGVGGLGGVGVGGVGGPQMNGLGVGGNAFPQYGVQRRAQLAQQGLGAMAGMRPPGKTGLTFDVVMSRLQGELQKSRETGAELTSLSGALNEINDTLSGNVAASVPQFPSTLPPVRPPQEAAPNAPGQSTSPVPGAASSAPTGALPPPPSTSSAGATTSAGASTSSSTSSIIDPSAIVAIQTQLEATQSSLATQSDKLKAFEEALAEQEKMRREVERLREVLIERGSSGFVGGVGSGFGILEREGEKHGEKEEPRGFEVDGDDEHLEGLEPIVEADAEAEAEAEAQSAAETRDERHERYDDEEVDDDDDDARSISTVMGHDLERVEEEDEGDEREKEREEDEESRSRRDEERGVGVLDVPAKMDEPAHEDASDRRHEHVEGEKEGPKEEEDDEKEREERKREDLGVGRPRTPEPGRLWLFGGQRRSSLGSSTTSAKDVTAASSAISSSSTTSAEELQAQIRELTAQVNAFVKLAGSLEERHLAAQEVIKRLEGKVRGLESSVKAEGDVKEKGVVEDEKEEMPLEAETEAPIQREADQKPHQEKEKEEKPSPSTLLEAVTPLLTEWRKSFESQISNDLSVERERMDRAREEWDRRMREVDERMGRVEDGQRVLSASVGGLMSSVGAGGVGRGLGLNGDVVKFGGAGGLVTPPSPRSQSSDSGRYRRRRRRRGQHGGVTMNNASASGSGEERRDDDGFSSEEDEEEGDEVYSRRRSGKAKASSSGISHSERDGEREHERRGSSFSSAGGEVDKDGQGGDDLSGSMMSVQSAGSAAVAAMVGAMPLGVGLPSALHSTHVHGGEVKRVGGALIDPARALATPAPSDRTLEGSVGSLDDKGVCEDGEDKREASQESKTTIPEGVAKSGPGGPDNLNVQTAVGVMLLSIAAAAVFWKIRPET
ncbi:hypothetical protein CVT24_002606 [Panaeolus cyanescens]|uniref:FHA domain-containing protein n=1 Tax=Panaeolus cyanescens TaxID=181874 RepID=A0A409YTY0_9AGAR|nr:hypothetical protein CVT24_002606 [Panaeolus cyanescens]